MLDSGKSILITESISVSVIICFIFIAGLITGLFLVKGVKIFEYAKAPIQESQEDYTPLLYPATSF